MRAILKTLLLPFILSTALVNITDISYADSSSSFQCDCNQTPCICFIQLGDKGNAVKQIIEILIDKGYLSRNTSTGMFSLEVETAVKRFQSNNKLKATGMMDDDTLTLLLWGVLTKTTDTNSVNTPKYVYIPTDGGKKRHLNPKCSKMEDPRKVSVQNAEKLGFMPCKKCNPK